MSVSIKQYLYVVLLRFIHLYRICIFKLWCMFGYKPPKAITVTTLSTSYEERQKQRLLDTYESSNDFNENIDKCFYNQAELREVLIEENNGLEKTWKTRILFENTPRGNIIMFYDAFKQGFAYYCDQTSLPYHLLNAVAMKYVTTYRCRDFFVDNQETPENHPSPLLEPVKTKEVVVKKEESVVPKKSAPFAKFKSYNMVNSKLKEEEKKRKKRKKRKTIKYTFVTNSYLWVKL